jgi:biopolymer transport protein ExbD
VKLERSQPPLPAFLFIAPALDVVLALVFFIVLSTSFLLQPGVEVIVPDSPFLRRKGESGTVTVSILAPPLSSIYFENMEVDAARLREKLESRKSRNHTLIIKTDKHASFDQLALVMNISLELGYPTVIATSEQP